MLFVFIDKNNRPPTTGYRPPATARSRGYRKNALSGLIIAMIAQNIPQNDIQQSLKHHQGGKYS
jgi:hypothetical protein